MPLELEENSSAPGTPPANIVVIYAKADGRLYGKDDLGTEFPMSITLPVPIASGGTGQTAAVAAFDALAPTTTKGDLIASNGSDNIRLGVGSSAQVLTADSAEASGMKWATPGAASSFSPSMTMEIYEEFITGNEDTDELGTYGWRSGTGGTGASLARIDGISRRPGIMRLTSGTTAASRSNIYLGESGSHSLVVGGGEIICEMGIRCTIANLATHARTMFGFGDVTNAAGEFTNGVYFRIQSGDTNWFLVSANGGTRSTSDTGIAYSSGTWVKFRFTVNAGATSIQAAINGTNAGSAITTNIPTLAISPNLKTDAVVGGTSMLLDCDYYFISQTFTTAR